jgi:glutamine---fructose-6-phosphate transaminase (isomerizing)
VCGIVGVVGKTDAAPVLLNALKKLEYRGYDSAGMATSDNIHLEIRKGIGKLSEVENNYHLVDLPGTSGIGHVRWATHGGVTIENAHPHTDCTGRIAIVHNGIIENYQELRDSLIARHKFTSQTDTEVIAHLLEEELILKTPDEQQSINSKSQAPNSLEFALYKVTKKLKGSYAILVISSLEPQKIVAARKDSPLVIGLGEKNHFLASDTLCFPDETKRAVYVEDGEIVVITAPDYSEAKNMLRATSSTSGGVAEGLSGSFKTVHIYDSHFQEIHKESVRLDYRSEEATKQGHEYFMLKEILEQPKSIRQALMQDEKLVMDMAIDMLRAKQIVLTACGTSRHAALVGRYVFSKLTGIFSEVVIGSEFQYFSDSIDKNTVVIAISQSGETADVIQGVKKAKEVGAKVFSLVNTRGSTLARVSDKTLYLHCGPEIAVAATKSFISQLSLFYLLSFAMVNRIKEGKEKMIPISYLIEENLANNNAGLAQLAAGMKDKNNFYYLGRGINYAIAGEGALKLKEIAYVHAEGMPAGELKHGTLALIESGTPVVAICPDDYTFDETISNTMETKARGAYVIGVSDKFHPAFDEWVHIPKVEEIFYPLVSVIPLQLVAYHSALTRGFDPDKPRNLAKSVTVK